MKRMSLAVTLALALGAGCNCDPGGGGGTGGGSSAGGTGGGSSGAGGGGAGACAPSLTLLEAPDGGAGRVAVNGLSRDGTTAVGAAEVGGTLLAFRWRAASGLQLLGTLDPAVPGSQAMAASADGERVVGFAGSSRTDCPGRTAEAFAWRDGVGMTALGDLPSGCFFSSAYGITADATLVVGVATNELAPTAAVYFSGTGWLDFNLAAGLDNSSSLSAVTPDGQVFAGTARVGASASYELLRVFEGGARVQRLGDLDGGATYASFTALSDDGQVLVGFGTAAAGQRAVRWAADGGLGELATLSASAGPGVASAVTPDGTLVVGSEGNTPGTAVLWTSPGQVQPLAALLGSAVPAGVSLVSATGISVVGTRVTVAGTAQDLTPRQLGFVARFCRP